jgi:hypothetical protein
MRKWVYPSSVGVLRGKVVRFLPMADCGYVRTATVMIIATERGDTLRLLQLCDTTKKIAVGEYVKFKTIRRPNKINPLLPEDSTGDCKVKTTFYGSLLKE